MTIRREYKTFSARFILAILSCIFPFIGCKKFVEVDPPVNETISDEIFKNESLAVGAITGIYSEMMTSSGRFSSGEVTFYAGMTADELMFLSTSFRDEFVKNQVTEAGQPILVTAFWDRAYRYIYTANICLEKMYAPTATISDKTKKMLEGECRFIRAFSYFHMVNLFGAVPMPLGSDFRVNMTLPRTPINDVYKQILEDLEIAKDLLLDEYPTAERVRPNRYAVLALLAKVYLYRYEWTKAESTATQIINNPLYRLDTLDSVFKKSSVEAIWHLLPVNSTFNNTWEASVIIPPSNSYVVTDTLYKSFEPNDRRKAVWLLPKNVSGPPPNIRYYPAKYRVKSNPNSKLEYYVVFRLAEQFLIRAEARAHLNKLTEAAADINIIRNRAWLSNTNASTEEELYVAIARERKIELFAEWGNRWYDLKRTQKADAELKDLPSKKATWTLNDTLWPIPNSQIIINPNLSQNPGY
jgi:starch-binding outer membrane protein, SusD/RagB family